ncbi:hypothetical protein [Chamaesiphon sp. OTE_75_metabat_556]|nr:hypothetical protein [Chamaesiphon sp. OTE_75_metabat_556]
MNGELVGMNAMIYPGNGGFRTYHRWRHVSSVRLPMLSGKVLN